VCSRPREYFQFSHHLQNPWNAVGGFLLFFFSLFYNLSFSLLLHICRVLLLKSSDVGSSLTRSSLNQKVFFELFLLPYFHSYPTLTLSFPLAVTSGVPYCDYFEGETKYLMSLLSSPTAASSSSAVVHLTIYGGVNFLKWTLLQGV
jgi:hypothetical protein